MSPQSGGDWVFVDFPIDGVGNTHVYIEKGGGYVRRCDTSILRGEGDVCQVEEDELRDMLEEDTSGFCPECVRFLDGVVVR